MKGCTVKKIFGGPCVGSGHRCVRVFCRTHGSGTGVGVVWQMQRVRCVDTRSAEETLTVQALRDAGHWQRQSLLARHLRGPEGLSGLDPQRSAPAWHSPYSPDSAPAISSFRVLHQEHGLFEWHWTQGTPKRL